MHGTGDTVKADAATANVPGSGPALWNTQFRPTSAAASNGSPVLASSSAGPGLSRDSRHEDDANGNKASNQDHHNNPPSMMTKPVGGGGGGSAGATGNGHTGKDGPTGAGTHGVDSSSSDHTPHTFESAPAVTASLAYAIPHNNGMPMGPGAAADLGGGSAVAPTSTVFPGSAMSNAHHARMVNHVPVTRLATLSQIPQGSAPAGISTMPSGDSHLIDFGPPGSDRYDQAPPQGPPHGIPTMSFVSAHGNAFGGPPGHAMQGMPGVEWQHWQPMNAMMPGGPPGAPMHAMDTMHWARPLPGDHRGMQYFSTPIPGPTPGDQHGGMHMGSGSRMVEHAYDGVPTGPPLGQVMTPPESVETVVSGTHTVTAAHQGAPALYTTNGTTPKKKARPSKRRTIKAQPKKTNTKEYPCDVCGKVFSNNGNRNRHKTVHTGVKPFVCQVCGKGFSQRSHVDTHQTVHTGEKQFQCPLCSRRFSQRAHLTGHLSRHERDENLAAKGYKS
eukprot:m.26003 g.26003  ORF g.26003 m.26003 type:complete len:500 (+) comp4282_c0_seq2:247-1746(+)